MVDLRAAEEIKNTIKRLEKSKEYHKDNPLKVNALENEIEVNEIALKAIRSE